MLNISEFQTLTTNKLSEKRYYILSPVCYFCVSQLFSGNNTFIYPTPKK